MHEMARGKYKTLKSFFFFFEIHPTFHLNMTLVTGNNNIKKKKLINKYFMQDNEKHFNYFTDVKRF